MDRRGFLGAILAAGAAPAIVRAESLMRIVTPSIVVVDSWQLIMDLVNERMVAAEKQMIAEFNEALYGPSLTEIVALTMQKNRPALIASIKVNNALLNRMSRRV